MENDWINKESDKFNRKCGEVLRLALFTEHLLEMFITNYFAKDGKYGQFKDTFMLGMNFERKIKIFTEICKAEGIDKTMVKAVTTPIDFVRVKRNKVAHYDACVMTPSVGKIRLEPRTTQRNAEDCLELTDEVMEELGKKNSEAYEAMGKLEQVMAERATSTFVRAAPDFI